MFSISCSPVTLGDLLRKVAPAISTRSSLPILQCIHLEAKAGILTCSATNLEVGLQAWSNYVSIQTEGSIAIQAKPLLKEVQAAMSQKVRMVSLSLVPVSSEKPEKMQLQIQYNGELTTFGTMDVNDFPLFGLNEACNTVINDDDCMILDAESIQRIQDLVGFACARDKIRPVFTTIAFHRTMHNGLASLDVIGGDSFRLSWLREKVYAPTSFSSSFLEGILIPIQSFELLAKVFPRTGRVQFALLPEGKKVIFETDHQRMVSFLLQGKYPPVRDDKARFMNHEQCATTQITLHVETMLKQCKTMYSYVSQKENILGLSITTLPNGQRIALLHGDNGDNAEIYAGKTIHLQHGLHIIGNDTSILFNCTYLLEILQAFHDMHIPSISLSLEEESHITWFSVTRNNTHLIPDYVYVLMLMVSNNQTSPADIEKKLRGLHLLPSTPSLIVEKKGIKGERKKTATLSVR